ncbi:MAG: FIST C-terminal domain-containing protein [Proteobacteria bacterium]|nr:FIST C-terminal domain-containing protein [Pseudomonadota bacterium]
MKTINIYYSNKSSLSKFINDNSLSDKQSILLQIFTGIIDKEYINNLSMEIKELLPNIKMIGSTTDGEILDGNISINKTVLSFSIFENTEIEIVGIKQEDSSFKTATSLINSISNIDQAKAAIIFSDGLNTNGELFLQAFNQLVPELIIAGGLAGDNANFKKTFVFTHEGIKDAHTVAAVLYNPELIINANFSFGWQSIGFQFTVTKAIENRVYRIDNQTPVELYKKYLGENIVDQLPATGIEFPLIIVRNGQKVARAVIAKEADGSLIFAGNINTGDKVWFGYGNVKNILAYTKELYQNVLQNPVESTFVYSCMARKRLLGDEIANEMLPLANISPISGFFTYGEFLHNKHQEDKNQLLNQTLTVLSLSENNFIKPPKNDITLWSDRRNILTVEALTHLVIQTTNEFQDLNKNLEEKVNNEIEKNRQKEQQLLQQSRLAQMGEMISMIAHQWRQPLSAISSTSAAINLKARLNKLDNDVVIDLSDKISGYSQHLSNTIDDFREFFKPNKDRRETNLDEIVESVLVIVEDSIKNKNINLIKQMNAHQNFNSYPNELKQVVLNLIKNAEDVFSDSNINQVIEQATIRIRTYQKGDYVIFEIKDNGGGIDENIIENIFDPYFSTKTKKDGTGLGLYMSKTIIEEHCGGQLSVSNDKEGAIFTISLETINA